jgi:hypothetical protein
MFTCEKIKSPMFEVALRILACFMKIIMIVHDVSRQTYGIRVECVV